MMKSNRAKVMPIIMFIVLLLAALPINTAAQSTINNEIEEHILTQLSRARIPNAAIAIIQDGETEFVLKDSGYNSLFQIGSISKSFTGFGVLLLEDMGLLCVTDPISDHLPWLEVTYRGTPVSNDSLTIYTFLQHTSGFTSDERRFARATLTETADEFSARIAEMSLAFYPSTAHVYGNINYTILGLLIEAVSGQSYDEFMTEHVLHPLGLYNTFTNMQRAHETGRVIGGHRLRFLQPVSWNPPVSQLTVPTGFIYSDLLDMVRWAEIHLGTVDISEQFERVVRRSHENNHSAIDPFANRDFFYAAGWNVHPERGTLHHNGSTAGYSSALRMLPDENTAVVVLGSLSHGAVAFGVHVLDIVTYGEPFGNIQIDMFMIFDVFFGVLAIQGIVYVGLLIRLLIKLLKRLRSGEIIKGKFVPKHFLGLIEPICSLAVFYFVPSIVFSTSREFYLEYTPASIHVAEVAIWVMAVYSVVRFLDKVFVEVERG